MVRKQVPYYSLGSKLKCNYKMIKVIFLCDISTRSDGRFPNWNPPRSSTMSVMLEYVNGLTRWLCEILVISSNYIGLLYHFHKLLNYINKDRESTHIQRFKLLFSYKIVKTSILKSCKITREVSQEKYVTRLNNSYSFYYFSFTLS